MMVNNIRLLVKIKVSNTLTLNRYDIMKLQNIFDSTLVLHRSQTTEEYIYFHNSKICNVLM